jgi:hypothetical protein
VSNLEESIKKDAKIRTVKGAKGSSVLLNLSLSDTASATTTLDAAGGAADQASFEVTLSNSKNLFMFGVPQMSIYVDSVAAANKVYGSSYNDTDFDMWQWLDHGLTDNLNVKLLGFIRNKTASSQTILVRVNWRFLIETE